MKKKPDYGKCEWFEVKLLNENRELWDLYRVVYGQHIMSGGLNILAVYETMNRMGICRDDQIEILDMIRLVDGKVIERLKLK
uniref:Uncharacterized protein n=1 Tax=viral metagenome TaxID=1070528 RepID=A0A6M3K9E6_9ZZZZ